MLIQVGEGLGKMEQDPAELLEERNKPRHPVSEQATSSAMGDPLTTTMARPAAQQTSFLMPKSLNILLGTPASIPNQLPHEMRKTRDDIGCAVERPKPPRLIDSSAVVHKPVTPQMRTSLPIKKVSPPSPIPSVAT